MSLEIKIPAVGESINEVTIAQWFKKDGDYVELDEVICELESDKATFELPAEGSGILKIVAEEGDTLEIGAVVCRIEESEKKESPAPDTSTSEKKAPTATSEVHEMRVPAVGESITEVTISSWFKKEGDIVSLDEIIAEVESDKATFELPAEANGKLQIVANEGDTLEIGALICKIEVMEGVSEESKQEGSGDTPSTDSSDSEYAKGHASPAAAKILREKGIDASQVTGTGVDGRITKEDAEKVEVNQKSGDSGQKAQVSEDHRPETVSSTVAAGSREEERKKMSSLRKTIAKRLVAVKNDTAMLTTFNEVNMQPIMDIRKKYKEMFKEKHEVGLGFMSFFTRACCQALLEWPAVNGKIDENELVYHNYCDISIAVSTPRGLVVPVIRNAEQMNFHEIEKEIINLATKARDGKLSIEEMTGGTFTITNGGVFGSMMSTPIINAPQSAILGMHNIVQRPVVENGEIVIRPMMYVALSYDHRIIDGRESVSFLVRVKELLEDPTRLLLNV